MNKLKQIKNIIITKPQKLDCGKEISNFQISYETYGTLNEKKDNAILVFHALTGDQFASGKNPITNKDSDININNIPAPDPGVPSNIACGG